MSLRQMEYFLTVAESGSFTRAADTLHVTQSALSHQLKALERHVGGDLLERLPRGVRLTAMGRAFLPHAERAVRSAVQAERAARAAAGAEGGELHVAAVHAVASGLLPPVFAAWRRAHPGVELVLHEYGRGGDLVEAMERGVADVAVGHRPAGRPGAEWVLKEIGEEEVLVVLPPGDPLAAGGADGSGADTAARSGSDGGNGCAEAQGLGGAHAGAAGAGAAVRSRIALAELAGRDWVRCAMEPVVEGRPFLDLACERAGFAPRTAVRTEHTSTAVRMAAAGAGVVAVPSYAVPDGCTAVGVDPPWRRPLFLFSRVHLTGAAREFAELLALPAAG
ncbi:LysR substrate-binding domain-containing protein [Streptomyces sp. NPDC020917]|uniref:LysR family transcriptional regulator n=1 Tax=Streptomyces sp. NPDC020917 TaxID=3365102 RepID=UPI00378DC907